MNEVVIVDGVSKTFKVNRTQGIANVLKKVRHSYLKKRLVALDNISFSVSKGEMLGIIGINASGKTTLLRTLAGIYQPDSGTITIKGRLSPLLTIGTGFHRELIASENILLSGMLLGLSKNTMKSRVGGILEFAELEEFSNMKLKHYSAGMRARLAFSTALQVDPDILLIDEILSVGDIQFRKKSFEKFLEIKEKGKTILYTTHNLGALSRLCDRVLLLHNGKAVSIGEPKETIQLYREMTNQDYKK